MLTAEQKIRLTLTGSPSGKPQFQHEGEEVIRWITGGTLPDVYVTFHHEGNMIELRCATCQASLGSIAADYRGNTPQQVADIRRAGHQHKT